MAMFIARAMAGADSNVPAAGTVWKQEGDETRAYPYGCVVGGASLFTDVAPNSQHCRHAHYIVARGVTTGCTASTYCSADKTTRAQMAMFIARSMASIANHNGLPIVLNAQSLDSEIPPAYSATPPPAGNGRGYACVSVPPEPIHLHFTDVPAEATYCSHVHYLWAKEVTDDFGALSYKPGDPMKRKTMAKFLADGFGLRLYRP
jgi:hypothetical protein